ncbi:DUF6270 domain-containing protein [Brachybacterium tyrofermentans]|uniref:DUF6270 domain-containing protein n=1 Tax=Brachybacterium tyrofermentans TaxID=47848 RepID=UPI003FD0D0F7
MPLSIDGARVPESRDLKSLVYGSCVSRDLVELFRPVMSCTEYIARQAWVSSGNPSVPLSEPVELESRFQRRMVEGDFAGDAHEQLDAYADKVDVVLLDIVDDRFGVYPVAGGYVTPSAEFNASGLRHSVDLGDHIPFGTPDHLTLWSDAAEALWSVVEKFSDKTFLLGANFTDVSVDGGEVPAALGRGAGEWNDLFYPYYEKAREIGFQVLMLPDAFAVSTPHHKWNAAPFHYVEHAYGWWYESIRRSL